MRVVALTLLEDTTGRGRYEKKMCAFKERGKAIIFVGINESKRLLTNHG
jgi:hypothetical protein